MGPTGRLQGSKNNCAAQDVSNIRVNFVLRNYSWEIFPGKNFTRIDSHQLICIWGETILTNNFVGNNSHEKFHANEFTIIRFILLRSASRGMIREKRYSGMTLREGIHMLRNCSQKKLLRRQLVRHADSS